VTLTNVDLFAGAGGPRRARFGSPVLRNYGHELLDYEALHGPLDLMADTRTGEVFGALRPAIDLMTDVRTGEVLAALHPSIRETLVVDPATGEVLQILASR
jgi:hypothetical protein